MKKLVKILFYGELVTWGVVLIMAVTSLIPFFIAKHGVSYEYVRLYLSLTGLFAFIPLCFRASRTAIKSELLSVAANDQ
jgi:hypothetical protein